MIVQGIVAVVLGLGALLCVTGAVGLVRFPDVYSRMHAAGVTDTGGAGLITLALLIWVAAGDDGWLWALADDGPSAAVGGLLLSFKLISVLFFLWVSGTTAVHALAKAAWLDGVRPWTGEPPAEGDA